MNNTLETVLNGLSFDYTVAIYLGDLLCCLGEVNQVLDVLSCELLSRAFIRTYDDKLCKFIKVVI